MKKSIIISACLTLSVIVGIFLAFKDKILPSNNFSQNDETYSAPVSKTSNKSLKLEPSFEDDDAEDQENKFSQLNQFVSSKTNASLTPEQKERQEKAKNLLHATGVEKRLLNYRDNVKNQFEAAFKMNGLNEEDAAKLIKTFQKAIDPDEVLAQFEDELMKNFTAKDLEYISEKFQNEHFQRFIELEDNLSDPQAMQKFQEDFTEYLNKHSENVSEKRLQLITDYDKASQGSEQVAEMTVEMLKESGITDEEMLKNISEMAKEQVRNSYLFVTRDMDDAAVSELVEMAKDEKVQKYNEISRNITRKPFAKVMAKAAKNIQKLMEAQMRQDLGADTTASSEEF